MINQNNLRKTLINKIDSVGLKSKAIALNTGITQSELSRFKRGHSTLYEFQAQKLEQYLKVFDNLMV